MKNIFCIHLYEDGENEVGISLHGVDQKPDSPPSISGMVAAYLVSDFQSLLDNAEAWAVAQRKAREALSVIAEPEKTILVTE